ncbi:hypothetical protein BDW67DRAFT_155334 [Aspergillus spinulosporus]
MMTRVIWCFFIVSTAGTLTHTLLKSASSSYWGPHWSWRCMRAMHPLRSHGHW